MTKFTFKLDLPDGERPTIGRALSLLQLHLNWGEIGDLNTPYPPLEKAFRKVTFDGADVVKAAELALDIARNIDHSWGLGPEDTGNKAPLANVALRYEPDGVILWNRDGRTEIRAVAAFAQTVQENYRLAPIGFEWSHEERRAHPVGGAVWLRQGRDPEWASLSDWLDSKAEAHAGAQPAAGTQPEPM